MAFMETRQTQSPPASRPRNAPPPLPFLPDELTVEILSWLPVKSLLQFRCVCKSWKSIISDSNFVKLHLHRSSATARKSNKAFFHRSKHSLNLEYVHRAVNSSLGIPSYTIDHDNCYTSYTIGSCNGLVCLPGYFKGNKNVEYCFYLWNPATKLTSKELACLPVNATDFYRFAFGYDNLSDTYKVLAFNIDYFGAKEESQKIQVKICSLADNYWRNIPSFPGVPLFPLHFLRHGGGVYFNGTLNWLTCCNTSWGVIEWNDPVTIAQSVIVSFDLGTETYKQLLLPRFDEAPCFVPTIGVLMDCLYFSHESMRPHFVVWQMKEFGVQESWTQLVRVSYQDLQFDWLDLPFPLLPLCMSDNGDVLIMVPAATKVIMFHWRGNRVEQIEQHPKYLHYWDGIIDYVESLVSPCCS